MKTNLAQQFNAELLIGFHSHWMLMSRMDLDQILINSNLPFVIVNTNLKKNGCSYNH